MMRTIFCVAENGDTHETFKNQGRTYALVDLWLVGSCRTASSFSSSSLLRREPGTDFDGSLSSIISLDCMIPP